MRKPFAFKQFILSDDGCGMLLTSDAVLLGAFAKPPKKSNILDIGCGCGILSLMMAQQSPKSEIDALDIDHNACVTARKNADNSKWGSKITIYKESIQNYALSSQKKYDYIICNPPYFSNQLQAETLLKNTAKHTVSLSYHELFDAAKKVADSTCHFWLVMASSQFNELLVAALAHCWYAKECIYIQDTPDTAENRIIIQFQNYIVNTFNRKKLIIKDEMGQYTKEYVTLTRDFYNAQKAIE